MSGKANITRRDGRFLLKLILLTAVYFIFAKFGLMLAFRHRSATAVWPPTGIALAALVLGGRRFWPAVFLGALFTNLTNFPGPLLANFMNVRMVSASLGIAVGNSLEALLGSYLASRLAEGPKAFDRPANIFRWTVFVALLSTAVSATVGVTTLTLTGLANRFEFGTVWLTWWLGDAGGALGVAPLLILWAGQVRVPWSRQQVIEALIVSTLLWMLGEFGFGIPLGIASRTYPLGFAFLPLLAWAAFRLDRPATAAVGLAISIVSVWGTIRGHGSFAVGDPNESLLLVEAFLGVTTTTALALAAAVEERRRAQQELSAVAEERKRVLQALQELNRTLELRVTERTTELKEAVTELEGFSYTAAHDLRAPLRAIAGFSQLLRTDHCGQMDEVGREYLDRIANAAGRMDELVQDLLSYSKLTREEVHCTPVDVEVLVREILSPMERDIRERRARIQVEGPLSQVLAHRVMLSQALSNLVGNAIKFVAPGVTPEVQIRGEERGGKVRIWVRDNGIGIDPAHHKMVFEVFHRLDPGRFPGTGVGLAIVRKALERMSGSSGVESSLGHGSRFWVELPAAPRVP